MDDASIDTNMITAKKIVMVINNIKIIKRILSDDKYLSNEIKMNLKERKNGLIILYNNLAKEYNNFISSYKNEFEKLSYCKIKM